VWHLQGFSPIRLCHLWTNIILLFSFPIWMPFISFSCLIALCKSSSAIVKEVVKSSIFVFFLTLEEKLLVFHHWVWQDWCWSWRSYTLATWCEDPTHWKRSWYRERLRAGGDRGNKKWDGWMASLSQWTWVWVNSGRWWWTGAGASRQSRSGPENVHGGAKKETKARDYNKDGVERFRHVSTKGCSLTPTLFSILYLYRRSWETLG